MARCTYAGTTSGGRVSRCPNEAGHSCGKCETHCKCPVCVRLDCTLPRSCRACQKCSLHCQCGADGGDRAGEVAPANGWETDSCECPSRPADYRPRSCSSDDGVPDEVEYYVPTHTVREDIPLYEVADPSDVGVLLPPRPDEPRDSVVLPGALDDILYFGGGREPGACPVAYRPLEVDEGVLWLRQGECRTAVTRASDLLVRPWTTCRRADWSVEAAAARASVRQLLDLVWSGRVTLAKRRVCGAPHGGMPRVVLDVPLPWCGMVPPGFAVVQGVSLSDVWGAVCTTEAVPDGPSWTCDEMLVCVEWARHFSTRAPRAVTAYRAPYGGETQKVMGIRRNAAFEVARYGEVRVYAYAADVFSDQVEGLWVDPVLVREQATLNGTCWYTIGEDYRSGLIAPSPGGPRPAKGSARRAKLKLSDMAAYPCFELSWSVAFFSDCKKARSYEHPVGSQITVADRPLALALGKWSPPLPEAEGAIYGIYRECCGVSDRGYGKVPGKLLVSSGLITSRAGLLYAPHLRSLATVTARGIALVADDGGMFVDELPEVVGPE